MADSQSTLMIVGFGPSVTLEGRRIGPPAAVWTINNAHAHYGLRTDRIIAMDDLRRDWDDYQQYVTAIVTAGVPVYTSGVYPEWPDLIAYPLADVLKTLGMTPQFGARVLSNSWCYAMALAIHEGWKSVELIGAEFVAPDSWWDLVQAAATLKSDHPEWMKYYKRSLIRNPTEPGLPGLCYLLGVADARGMTILIPRTSTLMDMDREPFFYGYSHPPQL